MIRFVESKSQLIELASRVWEDIFLDIKMDEMLSSICRWGLHTRVLDVLPECMVDN